MGGSGESHRHDTPGLDVLADRCVVEVRRVNFDDTDYGVG